MSKLLLSAITTLTFSTLALAQGGPFVNRPLPPAAPAPVVTTEVVPEPAPSRTPVSDYAGTDNQGAVAGAFDDLATGGGGRQPPPDARTVDRELHRLPQDQRQPGLDQLSPAGNNAFTDTGIAGSRSQSGSVNDHLNGRRIGEAFGEEPPAHPLAPWGLAFWQDGGGRLPDDIGDYTTETIGVSGGIDWRINGHFIVGVHAGFTTTDLDFPGASSGEADAVTYGAYGAFIFGNGYLQGGVDQSDQAFSNSRHIGFGSIERTAESSHDGTGRSAFLAGGYDFKFGNWGISPSASIRHTIQREDAYTETGADSLNLDVDRQDSEGADGYLGTRLNHSGTLRGIRMTQRLNIGWGRNFNTDGRTVTAGFADAGGSRFTMTGPDTEADSLELGGGFTAHFLLVTAFVDYSASINADGTSQAVKAGVRSIF